MQFGQYPPSGRQERMKQTYMRSSPRDSKGQTYYAFSLSWMRQRQILYFTDEEKRLTNHEQEQTAFL
jgi:hypothetical protein